MRGKLAPTKMDRSILPAVQELERFFKFFNQKLYKGSLPQPIITIQSAGRRKYLGWFCADIWRHRKNEVPEINITAEELNRPVEDILETLLHEMVHLDNWHNDIVDCSAQQYHNKKFKLGCDEIKLNCERNSHGWAYTSLSPELRRLIKAGKPKASVFKIFRLEQNKGGKSGPGSRLKKWTCGCTNIRVAVSEFDATCNLCGNEFFEAE